MALFNREGQSLLQPLSGLGAASQLEHCFPKENSWHHPVGLFFRAPDQVFDGIDRAFLGQQGLRKAEAKQLVVGLLRDESGE
jgi:hypothetical protein